MGRVKSYKLQRRTKRHSLQVTSLLRAWILPLLVAASVIAIINTQVKADYAPNTAALAQYVQTHNLDAYHITDNGYQQVFYRFNGYQVAVTTDGYNHTALSGAGPFIAWQGLIGGGSQIFLYDVLTKTTVQLTASGTNESPRVSKNGMVTWQTWDGQNWQVMYYNGISVQQVTNDASHSSVSPVTDGSKIVYAEELAADDWKAQSYDIASGNVTTLREGDTVTTAYPQINANGSISTAFVPPM